MHRAIRAWFAGRTAAQRTTRIITAVGAVMCVTMLTAWVGHHVHRIRQLRQGVGDTVFLGADGRPWFRMDERRADVPLADISPHLQRAVVAIEDRRFYRHHGVDP